MHLILCLNICLTNVYQPLAYMLYIFRFQEISLCLHMRYIRFGVIESSFLRSLNNQVNFISNFRSLFLHSYVVEGHMRKNYSPANEPSSPALYRIKCGIVKLLLPLSISWYALDIRYRIAYTHAIAFCN